NQRCARRALALRLARLVGLPHGRRSYGQRSDLNAAATLPRARRHDAIIALAKKIQRCAICFERSSRRFQNSDQFQTGTAAGRRLHSAFDAIDKMLALYLQRFFLLNVGNIAVPVMIGVMKLRSEEQTYE